MLNLIPVVVHDLTSPRLTVIGELELAWFHEVFGKYSEQRLSIHESRLGVQSKSDPSAPYEVEPGHDRGVRGTWLLSSAHELPKYQTCRLHPESIRMRRRTNAARRQTISNEIRLNTIKERWHGQKQNTSENQEVGRKGNTVILSPNKARLT